MNKAAYIDLLMMLIKDEQSAIGLYNAMIDSLPRTDGYDKVALVLRKIQDDEEWHAELLYGLLKQVK
jgi:rubrerythrin